MAPPPIYLDHAATTPLAPEVREVMRPYLEEHFGNPSSLHRWGKVAKQAIEKSRAKLACCLNGDSQGFIFTSGGTEANNLAILGYASQFGAAGKKHLITTPIEHPSILEPVRFLESQGWSVTLLPVDGEGRIRLEDLESALTPETGLVSIMHGNNEIGTLQPIEEIGAYLQRQEVFFHTDAVQTVGKVPIDLSRLPVDALTLSAHKLYGPKGVGALYVRPGAPNPQPLLMGGGQQNNLRSGTENVAGIVGLAAALEICVAQMPQETARQFKLMQFLIETLEAKIPTAVLNGPRMPSKRVPGNVHFSFPPLGGDALVLQMDLRGFAVSSGSACHSAVIEPSHVVLALGKSREIAQGTLRFSLGRNTTEGQLQEAVSALCTIVERLSERASQPISSS